MMKKIVEKVCFLLILATSLNSCGSGNPVANPFIDQDWASDPLWDDGLAEVCLYDATRKVYGTKRNFEYVYVTVKEDFNKEYHVKTDDYTRDDLYPVIKVNKFCRIETLVYPYHYLTSIFFRRENPATVHKLTNTSQEWCGNTAKSFLEKGNHYLFDYMSYFDGQGNGHTKIERGPWFEDQLSYTLRTLQFKDNLAFEIQLYPSQITNQAKIPEPIEAKVEVHQAKEEELSNIPEDFIQSPWKVTITRSNVATLTYWFNDTYPNYLLKMEASDGRSLVLKKTSRDAYWSHE